MNPSVLEACVKGYSHIQSGKECQDSCKSEKLQDGTLLLSVADGHGSKSSPHSKDGSDIAVNVFCQTLSDLYLQNCGKRDELIRFLNQEGNLRLAQALERKWKDRVYRTHVDMLHREVPTYDDGRENLSALYRMYGTTLLGMVIAPDFFFVFQLGDGDIVYVDDRGVQNLVEADKLLGVESDSLCSHRSDRLFLGSSPGGIPRRGAAQRGSAPGRRTQRMHPRTRRSHPGAGAACGAGFGGTGDGI